MGWRKQASCAWTWTLLPTSLILVAVVMSSSHINGSLRVSSVSCSLLKNSNGNNWHYYLWKSYLLDYLRWHLWIMKASYLLEYFLSNFCAWLFALFVIYQNNLCDIMIAYILTEVWNFCAKKYSSIFCDCKLPLKLGKEFLLDNYEINFAEWHKMSDS